MHRAPSYIVGRDSSCDFRRLGFNRDPRLAPDPFRRERNRTPSRRRWIGRTGGIHPMMRVIAGTLVAAGLLATSASAEFKYKLDGKNTEVEFVGTKPQGKHTGGFKKLKGHVSGAGSDVT